MADGKIAQAALAPTIRLLSNFRLVVVVVMGIVCFTGEHFGWILAIALLTIPQNIVLLFKWGRPSAKMVVGAYFTVWDSAVVSWMLVVSVGQAEYILSLVTAYVLLSSLILGMLAGNRSLIAWWIPVMVALFCIGYLFNSVMFALLIFAAIAPLMLMGKRLTRQMVQVEALAADVVEARSRQAGAEERLILARDLHDTVAKSAAGLRMLSEALRDSLSGSQYYQEANQLFDAAAALSLESRAVLDELRSYPTNDLVQLIKQDVVTWGNRTGIPIHLKCDGASARFTPAATWQTQRIVGELLSNIEKHSEANQVWFSVNCTNRLLFTVEDDGIGLPKAILDDISNLQGSGHYGLCGLRERVELLEGRVSLMKGSKGGTMARVEMPLNTEMLDSMN